MRSILSAALAALLFAACSASQPTPAEDAAAARLALSTLLLTCARLPAGVDPRISNACAALAKADGLVAEVCPAPAADEFSAGSGGR